MRAGGCGEGAKTPSNVGGWSAVVTGVPSEPRTGPARQARVRDRGGPLGARRPGLSSVQGTSLRWRGAAPTARGRR